MPTFSIRHRGHIAVVAVVLLIGTIGTIHPPDAWANTQHQIDLAAIVLTPGDLAAEGLTDYGLDYGELLAKEQIAAGFSAEQGIPLDESVAIFDHLGLVQSYSVRIAQPTEPGDFLSVATAGVWVSLVEYNGSLGAAAAFSIAEEDAVDAGREIVEGRDVVGDESFLSLGDEDDAETGDPSRDISIEFRSGRFYAVVTVFDVARDGEATAPEAPAVALVEALASRQLDRIATAEVGDLPSLGLQAVRLASDERTIVTVGDRYQTVAGEPLPRYAETAAELAERATLLDADGMTAVYGVEQDVRSSPEETPGEPHLAVRLYQFVDAESAAAWLEEIAFDRFAGDPYLDSIDLVETPSELTDADLVGTYAAEYAGVSLEGTVFWVHVDDTIARISIDAADGIGLDVLATLVEAQFTCLEADLCDGLVAI